MNNETQKTIEFYKSQIKTFQEEIKRLTDQEKPTEQKPMFGQALRVEDVKYWLDGESDALPVENSERHCFNPELEAGNTFISKEAAELEAEKRRLRQLARVHMAKSWGDKRPDWSKAGQYKYCIYPNGDIHSEDKAKYLLYFRTLDHANDFLDEVGIDGIRKILEL